MNEHFIREQLPEGIGELSIHFGVFLGGLGDFTAPSIEHDFDNFRGCVSDVSFGALLQTTSRWHYEIYLSGLLQQYFRS